MITFRRQQTFFVQSYENKSKKIEDIFGWPVFEVIKEDNDDPYNEKLKPNELLPTSELITYKIFCKQLSNTPQEYREFLYEWEIDDVFEFNAISSAVYHCRNQK